MKTIIGILVLTVLFLGFSFSEAYAQISSDIVFVLEGSGYAVTEEIIQATNFDLSILTTTKSPPTTNFSIEDGFISLGDTEYRIKDLNGSFLRDGQFIRISGFVEDIIGEDATIRFFGRLVEESNNASVYGFTGRINTNDDSYKILYTSKLEQLSETIDSQTESTQEKKLTITINEGSSLQGMASNYIEASTLSSHYFSQGRISVEPGTTVTIVNGDTVAHSLVSGSGLGTYSSVLSGIVKLCSETSVNIPEGFAFLPAGSEDRDCDFIFDGKVNTGEIQPNESVTITFEEQGFYRLIDPNYPWMKIDGYVFSNIDNLIFGTSDQTRN